ncbi:MAG: preprotein translocase subunit SecG [Candidatus Doudnabacteria bacterium]|nr:preprotein translocase subunit SecG [Candidatus Doudnabacteria bacterium]
MEILTILKYICAISAAGLIVTTVLQNRSGGLGAVFGGSGGEAYRSKRGLEAFLYNMTIVLGIVLTISAILIAIVSI